MSEPAQEAAIASSRQEIARRLVPMCADMTPSRVPVTDDELADFGAYVLQVDRQTATRADCIAVAHDLLTRYLLLAAVDSGMTLTAPPGEPIALWQNGERAGIVDDWEGVLRGEIPADWWRSAVAAAGLRATVRAVAAGSAPEPVHVAPAPAPVQAAPVAVAPVAVAPAQSEPVFQTTPPGGKNLTLTLQGPVLRWGDQSVHADDVVTFRYRANTRLLQLVLVTAQGETEIKLRFVDAQKDHGAQYYAWRGLLDWCNAVLVPRMVDELLAQVRETGAVQLGALRFSLAGVDTATQRLPWSDFIASEFVDGAVVLQTKALTPLGFAVFARADTFENGAALVPELCRRLKAVAFA